MTVHIVETPTQQGWKFKLGNMLYGQVLNRHGCLGSGDQSTERLQELARQHVATVSTDTDIHFD